MKTNLPLEQFPGMNLFAKIGIVLLLLAVAMVAHTLRYRSQLVTGLAFLLALSMVALTQDNAMPSQPE